MARPKEFDPDSTLERAMDLFRRQGFAATSMQQLVDHMGIGRASLYETFGGKEQLFAAALERYLDAEFEQMVASVGGEADPLDGVRALLRRAVDFHVADRARCGCLGVNTVVELAPHHAELADVLRQRWQALEKAVMRALRLAQSQGRLGSEKKPLALARFFVGVVQGLAVRAKYDSGRVGLRDVVDTAVAILD